MVQRQITVDGLTPSLKHGNESFCNCFLTPSCGHMWVTGHLTLGHSSQLRSYQLYSCRSTWSRKLILTINDISLHFLQSDFGMLCLLLRLKSFRTARRKLLLLGLKSIDSASITVGNGFFRGKLSQFSTLIFSSSICMLHMTYGLFHFRSWGGGGENFADPSNPSPH